MQRYRQPSTTSAAGRGSLKPARPGQRRSPSEARTPPLIRPGGARTPVTVTLQLMPGAEPWVRITREGRTWRCPATHPLWHYILLLNGWCQDG